MTPMMEQYIRRKAADFGVDFDFELSEDMKKWLQGDWITFLHNNREAQRKAAMERRDREYREYRLRRFTEACHGDVEMAQDLMNVGMSAYHAWASRMSLEQFTDVGYLMFPMPGGMAYAA